MTNKNKGEEKYRKKDSSRKGINISELEIEQSSPTLVLSLYKLPDKTNSKMKLMLLMFLAILCTHSVECFRRRSMPSVCLVADSIQVHNSHKGMWWTPYRKNPIMTRRSRDSHYNSDWLVFMMPSSRVGISMTSFAHRTSSGNCRFLRRASTRATIEFTDEIPCNPHLVDDRGHFFVSFDSLSDRVQITTVSGYGSSGNNVFLGSRGRSVVVTSMRSRHMQWWNINFSQHRRC